MASAWPDPAKEALLEIWNSSSIRGIWVIFRKLKVMLLGQERLKCVGIYDRNSRYFVFVSCPFLPGKMARNVLPPYSQTDKLRGVFIGSIYALDSYGQDFWKGFHNTVPHTGPTLGCVIKADVTVIEAMMTVMEAMMTVIEARMTSEWLVMWLCLRPGRVHDLSLFVEARRSSWWLFLCDSHRGQEELLMTILVTVTGTRRCS